MVTAVVLAARGCQGPVQRLSRRPMRATAGSPDENVAITAPVVMKVPQSSITRSSSEVGQAAVVVKPDPSWVKTGYSLVGVQPSAKWGAVRSCLTAPVAGRGVTTNRISTRRVGMVVPKLNR